MLRRRAIGGGRSEAGRSQQNRNLNWQDCTEELAEVKQERDLAKKFAAYFAKESR